MKIALCVTALFAGICTAAMAQKVDQTGTVEPVRKDVVVVTGTYAPTPLDEADRTVHVIETGKSVSVFPNAMDALQTEPAVDLRERAPGIQGDLSIRGSTFGQTLVLLDGLRVNDVQTGHNNLDLPLPFQAVQRVEILEGSGSTLYGADAVGGAVNFLTAAPERSDVRVGAAAGNFGTNREYGAIDLVRGAATEALTFDRELSTGFMPDRDYRSLALASDTRYRWAPGDTDLLLGLSDRPFGAAGFYGSYPSWERTRGWFAGVRQQIGKATDVLFGFRRHTDLFDLFRYQPSIYENRHLTYSWEAAVRRQNAVARNARVFYGLEGYRDSIRSTNLGQHTRDRGALYAAVDLRAVKRFSVEVGVREELLTGGQKVFTPSAAGGYWFNGHLQAHAAVSNAFRLPSFTDLYYSDPANLGNPNLRPERAWSYEGGLQYVAGRCRADAVLFRRNDRDVIDYVRANGEAVWQAENIDRINFTGFEGSVQMQFGEAQRIQLAYAGLHGAQAALGAEQSKYLFEYPVHSGTATWFGHWGKWLDGYARIGVLDRYGRDPYPLMELSAWHTFPHAKPYLHISNMTNTGYEEIPGVRMPGRSYLIGLEIAAHRVN